MNRCRAAPVAVQYGVLTQSSDFDLGFPGRRARVRRAHRGDALPREDLGRVPVRRHHRAPISSAKRRDSTLPLHLPAHPMSTRCGSTGKQFGSDSACAGVAWACCILHPRVELCDGFALRFLSFSSPRFRFTFVVSETDASSEARAHTALHKRDRLSYPGVEQPVAGIQFVFNF